MTANARHEFHVEGDQGYAVVLPANEEFWVESTRVTRISTGPTTSDDVYLFRHFVERVKR